MPVSRVGLNDPRDRGARVRDTFARAVPTVAVVIPAYNPGPLLRRALESVTAQTWTDWECVVVDDGGAEDLSWVDAFHPQVTRYRQQNSGVSAARNYALAITTAPFVAYLDQDDEWLPTKTALQVEALESGADFSWTSFRWARAETEDADDIGIARPIDYHAFLDDGHLCLSSLMVRRELLVSVGGFSPMLRVQQDYELVLKFLAADARGAPIDTLQTIYHLHDENVSSDYFVACKERQNVLAMHINAARWRDDREAEAAARAGCRRLTRMYGIKAFDAFRETREPTHLARALRWNLRYTAPAFVRGIRGLV